MIWWCRSDPINFSMPYSQIADLTLTLCFRFWPWWYVDCRSADSSTAKYFKD